VPAISQDETMMKALLAVLNSLVAKDSLRYVGRTYGGDTIKIEPREMDRLPVLNPLGLAPHEREKLAEFFDRLCQADSDRGEKVIRQAIDEAIAAMQGWSFLSEGSLQRIWDNEEDAAYDNWRELYGVPAR
jgi:hypothetical protein